MYLPVITLICDCLANFIKQNMLSVSLLEFELEKKSNVKYRRIRKHFSTCFHTKHMSKPPVQSDNLEEWTSDKDSTVSG